MDYFSLAAELLAEQMKLFRARGHQQIYNLSMGEMYTLFLLEQAGGTLQPGRISEAMNVTTACVASTLRTMERKNLISREVSKQDRRYINVVITPLGRNRLTCASGKAVSDLERILERLGEQEAMEYLGLVSRLAQILSDEETD